MGRKRKRAKAPATGTPEADSSHLAEAQSTAVAADPTSPMPQQATLGLDAAAATADAKTGDTSEQVPADDEDSSDGMPGIPWALPPEESDQTDDEDEEQEEEEGAEEDGEQSESSGAADGGGSSSLSTTMQDPENRWKQHPDRRRKLAGGGSGGGGAGRGGSNSSSNGAGRPGAKSGGRGGNRRAPGRGGRGGGRGRRGEENAAAEAGLDEAKEDDCPVVADGYYGPPPPLCTVFAPRSGKIHRVTAGSPSTSRAPTTLVVGLDPLEQLCFVGAALVRCGRGQADLSGYTLLPAAWGAYVEAHSPRWMGLLVVRALDAEEYSDAVARGGGGDGSGGNGASAADNDAAENEIEEAIDRIAEDFPVVVVLRSLSGSRPLEFLSAQADADALYAQTGGAGDRSVGVDHQALHHVPEGGGGQGEQDMDDATTAADSSREGPGSLPLRLAAELRLPGMQVVVTTEAGLVPFTVPRGWADAANAVLAAPPPTTGGDGGGAVLVCGAKGVGKSTLCRFLVNRMLSRHKDVAYIDCDLGQPEFTAPGQVSLHLLQAPVVGPPHANIRRPQLAYFVGTTTSKPEPLLYSAAVRALAERASAGVTAGAGQHEQKEELSTSFLAGSARPVPPLVVNTDGWVKGMGEDLLGAVIDAVRPRHIVQILGTSTAKKFAIDLSRLPEGCQVHRVEAWSPPPVVVRGPSIPPRPSAQDQRTLRLVAYFLGQGGRGSGATAVGDASDSTAAVTEERRRSDAGDVANGLLEASASEDKGSGGGHAGGSGHQVAGASMRGGKVHDLQHEVAALLAAAKPRRVPWRAVQIRVMNGSVSPSLVLHAINGALVGLVVMPRQPYEGGGGGGGVEPPIGEGLVCLAETPLAPCVGLGIVRSVDVEKRVLYVLTPEPADVLKDVNVLVVGSLHLPMVMVYDPNWCSHPYFSSEVVGGGVIKNRSNLLRKGGQNG